jgi:hypothetical protein
VIDVHVQSTCHKYHTPSSKDGLMLINSIAPQVSWLAAILPRLIDDSRKVMELHLAEYPRQTKAMLDGFASTSKQHTAELKTAVELHTKITQQAAEQIQVRLANAEVVARRVISLMENAASEWKEIKAAPRLNANSWNRSPMTCRPFRVAGDVAVGCLVFAGVGYGICIGHYWHH